MPDPQSNPELLRSLGRLARGLSALFWGLPMALVIGVQTARTDWLRAFGMLPTLCALSLLLYGLIQLGYFQRQERAWIRVLDRAQMLAVIDIGLSPFLYWWYRLPQNTFYTVVVSILAIASLAFLCQLNVALQRLTSLLPDETLRHETQVFAALNISILGGTIGLLLALWALVYLKPFPILRFYVLLVQEQGLLWFLVLVILVPVSSTMALIWKIKETILSSLFGQGN